MWNKYRNTRTNTKLILFVLIILIYLSIFSRYGYSFLLNMRHFIAQDEYIIVMITGIMIIMQGGGIDLSVGWQIGLTGVILGILLESGLPIALCILGCVAAGILCGLVNGILIAVLRLPPLIATLISQEFFRGFTYLISGGQSFYAFPDSFLNLTDSIRNFISGSLLIAVISIISAGLFFSFTYPGKVILAMGYDEDILKHNNINVRFYRILSYVLGSLFFALSSVILVSRQGIAVPNMGSSLELRGLFAACIAGAGGILIPDVSARQRIPFYHYYIGALIACMTDKLMLFLGFSQYLQYIFMAFLVLISMLIAMIHKDR